MPALQHLSAPTGGATHARSPPLRSAFRPSGEPNRAGREGLPLPTRAWHSRPAAQRSAPALPSWQAMASTSAGGARSGQSSCVVKRAHHGAATWRGTRRRVRAVRSRWHRPHTARPRAALQTTAAQRACKHTNKQINKHTNKQTNQQTNKQINPADRRAECTHTHARKHPQGTHARLRYGTAKGTCDCSRWCSARPCGQTRRGPTFHRAQRPELPIHSAVRPVTTLGSADALRCSRLLAPGKGAGVLVPGATGLGEYRMSSRYPSRSYRRTVRPQLRTRPADIRSDVVGCALHAVYRMLHAACRCGMLHGVRDFALALQTSRTSVV